MFLCLKVQLTTELSAAVSQVGTLQLECGNLHKQDSELKQQLAAAMAEVQSRASEWAAAIQSQKGWSRDNELTHTTEHSMDCVVV